MIPPNYGIVDGNAFYVTPVVVGTPPALGDRVSCEGIPNTDGGMYEWRLVRVEVRRAAGWFSSLCGAQRWEEGLSGSEVRAAPDIHLTAHKFNLPPCNNHQVLMSCPTYVVQHSHEMCIRAVLLWLLSVLLHLLIVLCNWRCSQQCSFKIRAGIVQV